MPNAKNMTMTFEELNEAIAYDPDLGTFTWKIKPAKNIRVGDPAGCLKGVRINRRTGEENRYLYIRLNGYEIPAGRVAWMLQTGEWPEGTVLFKDRDPSNLRFDNLTGAQFSRTVVDGAGKKRNVMTKEAMRHYGLKRNYGMTLAEYSEKHLAQNGVCAICGKPETDMSHGKVKPLAVDHDHTTGAIRDLLCHACNSVLGQANDNRDVLLAAVKYLDKHSGAEQAKPVLRSVSLDPQEVSMHNTSTKTLG